MMFEIFYHNGGKQTFLVVDNGHFSQLDQCTQWVASVMQMVEGLCKGRCLQGLV